VEDITLEVVTYDPENDSVITAKKMPAMAGTGSSDLKCGGCGEVLGEHLTTQMIDDAFTTDRRLLLACVCGTHNLVHEARAAKDATVN
jgi:hypothetical protein